jgi:hypothetical protein
VIARRAVNVDMIVGMSDVLRGVREFTKITACVTEMLEKSTRSPFGAVLGLPAAMSSNADAHEAAGKTASILHPVKACNPNPTIASTRRAVVARPKVLSGLKSKPSKSSFGSSTNELNHVGLRLTRPHLLSTEYRMTHTDTTAGIAAMYGKAQVLNLALVWSWIL